MKGDNILNILVIDGKGYYAGLAERLAANKSISLDYLTLNNTINIKGVNVHIGDRVPRIFRQLSLSYEYIIDTDAVAGNDVKTILENMNVQKYILFSTFQVYGFYSTKIIKTENMVGEDYMANSGKFGLGGQDFRKTKYICERLKCEQYVRQMSEHYVILRLSKVYTYDDRYKDISWVGERLRNLGGILLRQSSLMQNTMNSGIFVEDVVRAVELIVAKFPKESQIYNISQDEQISFSDIVQILSKYLGILTQYYVCSDNKFNGYLDNYYIPTGSGQLISNAKWNRDYKMFYTEMTKWIPSIYERNICIDDSRVQISMRERGLVKESKILQKRLGNFMIVEEKA